MKLYLFYTALLFTTTIAYAKKSDSTYSFHGVNKAFIEPASLIDIYNGPCIRLGAEVAVYRHFSAYGVGGVYINGNYAKLGLKYYGISKKEPELFLGISAFYKKLNYPVSDNVRDFSKGLGHAEPGALFHYEVEKEARGIHLEIGELYAYNHFAMEWYVGAGVRIKTIRLSISDSVQGNLYHIHESIIENFTNSSLENSLWPSLTIGMRIGYIYKCGKYY